MNSAFRMNRPLRFWLVERWRDWTLPLKWHLQRKYFSCWHFKVVVLLLALTSDRERDVQSQLRRKSPICNQWFSELRCYLWRFRHAPGCFLRMGTVSVYNEFRECWPLSYSVFNKTAAQMCLSCLSLAFVARCRLLYNVWKAECITQNFFFHNERQTSESLA